MPTTISSALENAITAVVNNLGVSGTYTRRADSATLTITGTMVETEYQVDDGSGVLQTWKAFDFVFRRQSFVFGGSYKEPERGDTFSYTDEFSNLRTFEVNFVSGEKPFRLGPHGHDLRIHTVER